MAKEARPFEALTESGRRLRKAEICQDAFGVSFAELIALVACVARWRTGEQSTTKLAINDEVLREEGVAPSDFGRLERIRLVRMVKKEGHQRWFVPTALALSKLEAFGRGEQAGAAE